MRHRTRRRASKTALAGAVLLFCGTFAGGAQAQTDGRRLLDYCEHAEKDADPQANPFRAAYCLAFIEGTLRGWEAGASVRDAHPNYCIATGTKFDQIMRAVTKYLRADASRLKGQAELQVITAVQRAFPCAPAQKKP
jgi:hypothetical protein